MKYLLLVVLILSQISTVIAQSRHDLPNIENPNLPFSYLKPLSFHNSLKSENRIKTTTSFKMLGKVKSVKEAVYTEKYLDNPLQRISYQFLENKNLLSYQEDTLTFLFNSSTKSDLYFYDSLGLNLVKIISKNGYPGYNSITEFLFDSCGYLIRRDFKKIHHPSSQKNHNQSKFDYTASYKWNHNRDSVFLSYHYAVLNSPYVRHKNQIHTYTSQPKLKDTLKTLPFNFFGQTHIDRTYDDRRNILKWHIIDMTIKGSYNVNQLYEFKYDLNNNLIEVKYSTNGPQQEYVLHYRNIIQYTRFDSCGNWIEKEVISKQWQKETHFTYERVMEYY